MRRLLLLLFVPAVIGFAYHGDVRRLFQHQAQSGADHLVIIGQQHPDLAQAALPSAIRGNSKRSVVPCPGSD